VKQRWKAFRYKLEAVAVRGVAAEALGTFGAKPKVAVPALIGTLKELEAGGKPGTLDIPLYDEEGLALAEHWEIRSVPAYVLVTRGRAHRMLGGSADLEALWECKK
jgi:hypothetical protein